MARIFFHTTWPHVDPVPKAGGPKVLQQHVRTLRGNGFDARIVLGGSRRWLSPLRSHETEIAMKPKAFRTSLSNDDVVVVPAIHARKVDSIPGRRKVIMVQNGGLFFQQLPLEETGPGYPWHHPNVEGIICVSERDQQLVQLTRPSCPVYRVFNAVDPNRFDPLPWAERENLILASPLLPYKNPWHVAALCHMVRSRASAEVAAGSADGAVPSVRVIQNLEPEEVETLLPRARVLVFLSVNEGFALLPLEAILAGTPVMAYPNQASDEFMPDAYLHDVSDFEGLVAAVEKILTLEPDDPWHRIRDQARHDALAYSAEKQESSLVDIWSQILGR